MKFTSAHTPRGCSALGERVSTCFTVAPCFGLMAVILPASIGAGPIAGVGEGEPVLGGDVGPGVGVLFCGVFARSPAAPVVVVEVVLQPPTAIINTAAPTSETKI